MSTILSREFLEQYPLYRKFRPQKELPERLDKVTFPAIHMPCPLCQSEQTFRGESCRAIIPLYLSKPPSVGTPSIVQSRGSLAYVVYKCAACDIYKRVFFLQFDLQGAWVMKVGQHPPWDISLDQNLEKMLGDRAGYYKKGLICESQSYGIGAFSYYRRIVEEIIDELLGKIADLMADEEQERYLEALEKVKRTRVTEEKIELVKHLLPAILRPGGINPLSILHQVLSEGLHQASDERCMELAMTSRETLVFLVNQIVETQAAAAKFTEGMRRLLDRKTEA